MKRLINDKEFILINNVHIYYKSYGSGTPIIFLHGNHGRAEDFFNQIEYFKDRYNVICIDSRGHGKSEYGKEDLTISDMATDIIEIIRKLNLKNIVLLGYSDGANIAINVAIRLKELLTSLILISPNINTKGIKKYYYNLIKTTYYICSKIPLLKNTSKRLSLIIKEPNINKHMLKEITCPSLIIVGDRDIITRKHIKLIYNALNNSKVLVIKNSNHSIIKNKSSIVNEIVEKFITEK